MSPAPDRPQGNDDPPKGGPSSPPSARDVAAPPSAREATRGVPALPGDPRPGKGRRGPGGSPKRGPDAPKKPRPVRSLSKEGASPPAVDLDIAEATFEADGREWIARVLGRAGGSGAPLLLLGFWGAEASNGAPELEALIVGHTLGGMTPMALKGALCEAKPPRARAVAQRDRGSDAGGGRRGRRGRSRQDSDDGPNAPKAGEG